MLFKKIILTLAILFAIQPVQAGIISGLTDFAKRHKIALGITILIGCIIWKKNRSRNKLTMIDEPKNFESYFNTANNDLDEELKRKTNEVEDIISKK